jgi:hypothetical protein
MTDHDLKEGKKLIWKENNDDEISDAKEMFQKYLQDGWLAFSESKKGREQIFDFDSKLARITLIPPLGGG